MLTDIEINQLVERLQGIPVGTKVTIVRENIFMEKYYTKATYGGNLETYGYILANGAWGLYGNINQGDKVNYRALFRAYRSKHYFPIMIPFGIIDFNIGWE